MGVGRAVESRVLPIAIVRRTLLDPRERYIVGCVAYLLHGRNRGHVRLIKHRLDVLLESLESDKDYREVVE